MSKILDWIKKHKVATAFIILSAFFLPLIFVHIAYRISAVTPWFSSTWNSGDLISYITGFEALFGSITLSAIVVYQNQKTNELNRQLIKAQEDQGVFERQPKLSIGAQIKYLKNYLDIYKVPKCTFASKSFFSYQQDEQLGETTAIKLIIKLHNKSDFRVVVSLSSLILSNDKEGFTLEFDNIPVIFRSYPLYLESGMEEEVAFVIITSEVNNLKYVDGLIHFILKNPISEPFTLSMFFSIQGFTSSSSYIHVHDYQITREITGVN